MMVKVIEFSSCLLKCSVNSQVANNTNSKRHKYMRRHKQNKQNDTIYLNNPSGQMKMIVIVQKAALQWALLLMQQLLMVLLLLLLLPPPLFIRKIPDPKSPQFPAFVKKLPYVPAVSITTH